MNNLRETVHLYMLLYMWQELSSQGNFVYILFFELKLLPKCHLWVIRRCFTVKSKCNFGFLLPCKVENEYTAVLRTPKHFIIYVHISK